MEKDCTIQIKYANELFILHLCSYSDDFFSSQIRRFCAKENSSFLFLLVSSCLSDCFFFIHKHCDWINFMIYIRETAVYEGMREMKKKRWESGY